MHIERAQENRVGGVNYILHLNAGLTKVLNDGTNELIYGTTLPSAELISRGWVVPNDLGKATIEDLPNVKAIE